MDYSGPKSGLQSNGFLRGDLQQETAVVGVFKHRAWSQDRKVMLANDRDVSSVQEFASRAELDAFIVELLRAADEAWSDTHAGSE